MAEYLLDTNHASRLMGQDPQLFSNLQRAETGGDIFGGSMAVMGELSLRPTRVNGAPKTYSG